MAINVPKLQQNIALVDPETGYPTMAFHIWWDVFAKYLESQFTDITDVLADIQQLQSDMADRITEITQLQSDMLDRITEIEAAQAAADAAQTTADSAATDAATAQSTADTVEKNDKLTASYTDPIYILSASDAGTDATISIAAHTRKYGDGTSVSISADTITGKNYSTDYFIYYNDSTYSDTTPNFIATTNSRTAQTNPSTGRHFVGAITTPAAGGGSTSGGSGGPPWWKLGDELS